MTQPDPPNDRLNQLRRWRNVRPERDLSLAFVKEDFKKRIEKPYKQLASVTQLWQQLVPADLVGHTRLERLTRGVLHITVDSSPRLYQLDRLLRTGLQQRLIVNHRGPAFRKIKLRVGRLDAEASG